MKNFEQLTERELVALTDEEVQRYVDYACAENGVPLLPALIPEPPKAAIPEPDAIAFAVGASYSTDVVCVKLEDANRVAELLNSIQTAGLDYVPGPGSERSITPKHGPYVVTPTRCYSAVLAATIRPAIQDAERARKTYETAKKDYDRAVNERAAFSDEIHEKVSNAWHTHRLREERRYDYQRYLSLADGNEAIARRFLRNAHHDAERLLPELFAAVDEPASVGAVAGS